MGCPVFKVVTNNAGSALLKDPNKVKELVTAVVKAVDIPVTVKIRSGWDKNSINAVEIAKIIEEAGASAISIHPRTRSEGYTGKADWNIIKEIKENVAIPVIGNGDVKSCYDAKKMLEYTKCDAVMIGRASLGNPWLFKECADYLEKNIEPKDISRKEKINMLLKHLDYLIKIKSEKEAMLEMRMHIAHYLKGFKNTSLLKQQIFKIIKKEELVKLLDAYLKTN